MIHTFFELFLIYAIPATALLVSRLLKIVGLHHEVQVLRAREQKIHAKSYAQILLLDFKSDLMWPIAIPKRAKQAFDWLREK